MNTDENMFQDLPADDAADDNETIPVEWSLIASRQLSITLHRIERYLPAEMVEPAINHLLIYHRQGGSPIQDWVLAYTCIEFDVLGSLESDAKLQMTLGFALDKYEPQVVQTDDTYEVFSFKEARQTPEQRTIIDFQVYRGDWTPPREPMSEVTERNNRLLSELEEIFSEHFGLDDPDAQLNPMIELFLTALGHYLDSEFTLTDDGLRQEGAQVTLHLTHNAKPMRLDIVLDMQAVLQQYEKMVREMP